MSAVPPEEQEPSGSPWAEYQRMRVRLANRMSQELARETGLSDADCDILLAISESASGSVRALALRCGLGWEKSRLSHQLRRMETRGLVAREDCREDNRGSVVLITAEGRAAAARARQLRESSVRRYFTEPLTARQRTELAAICVTVLAGLGEEPSTDPGERPR